MKNARNEKDIQDFVAKNPWLLNINYQKVPGLNKNGLEYYIEGNKRIDLILINNVTNCPVIVEFKYWDLKREDVGQILEYKARIFASFNDENADLFKIFGNKIFVPKLVLVVRSSDDYGRIACSLQNIELFEFGNMEKKIIDDLPFIKSVQEFSKSLQEHSPPITEDRNEYLQNNVYEIIKNIFERYGLSEKWHNYRNANLGEWYGNYKYIFLNRNLLPDEEVNIGIYEDILKDKDMSVCVAYYTWKGGEKEIKEMKKKLDKLEKLLGVDTNLTKNIAKDITVDEDERFEYWLIQKYNYKIFFKNVETIMEFNIKNYLKIFEI